MGVGGRLQRPLRPCPGPERPALRPGVRGQPLGPGRTQEHTLKTDQKEREPAPASPQHPDASTHPTPVPKRGGSPGRD